MGLNTFISSALESLSNNSQEQFQGYTGGFNAHSASGSAKTSPWVAFFTLIIIEILVLIFGKYLWNEVAVQLIPALKKVKNIWQILGLSILIKLLVN